jgi:predicted aspartyl protease
VRNHRKLPAIGLILALSVLTTSADDRAAEEVPFEVAGRVIFVKGTVNGEGPLTFILDTGATETVLTPPTAKRLGIEGLPVSPSQKRGLAASVGVGGAVVRELPVHIFDPPQALPLRLDQGMNYSGILGYTFLSRFVTTIDYRRLRVGFTPISRAPRIPAAGTGMRRGDGVAVPMRVNGGLIYAKGRINGRGPFTFLVDTGSAEVVIRPAVARRLGLPTRSAAPHPEALFSTLRQMSLGDATAAEVPAVVLDPPPDPSGASYDGIAGFPFLSGFRLTISYRDRMLTLTPGGD